MLRSGDRVRLRVELFDPERELEQLGFVVGEPEQRGQFFTLSAPVVWDLDEDAEFVTWHPVYHLERIDRQTEETK